MPKLKKRLPDFQSDELGLKQNTHVQYHGASTLPDFQSDELGLKHNDVANGVKAGALPDFQSDELGLKLDLIFPRLGGRPASRFPVRRIRIETRTCKTSTIAARSFPISSQTN